MKVFAVSMLFSIILSATGLTAADEAIEIAIPGQYSKADRVVMGDGWWGIARSGSTFTLEATSVKISAIPAMYQSPNEEPSGLSIAVPDDREYVAIVRGTTHFQAGPLVSTRSEEGAWRFLYPGERRDLTLDSGAQAMPFEVRATGTAIIPEGSPTIGFHNYALVLLQGSYNDGRRQTLSIAENLSIYERPEIIWAGDLDRDGRPDLIVDRTKGESETNLALFLSSAAAEGELVGLVAQWISLGPC